MQRVTSLEPRTPHQPGKPKKLSKNEFVFTPFIFRVNKKPSLLSTAKSIECRPSTTGCRIFCAIHEENAGARLIENAFSAAVHQQLWGAAKNRRSSSTVKIRQESCWKRISVNLGSALLCVLCGPLAHLAVKRLATQSAPRKNAKTRRTTHRVKCRPAGGSFCAESPECLLLR